MTIVSGHLPTDSPTNSSRPVQASARSGLAARRPTGTGRLLLGIIRFYQMARSGRPSPCRYLPSCSEYASEAVEVHGPWRGGWLALRRISRCHPFGGHGLDPVPGTGSGR